MKTTRRDFLKTSSVLSASAAAMTMGVAQLAHGEGTDETIKAVLVGCGGRGRGAVGNFLTAPNTKIIACADAFPDPAKHVRIRGRRTCTTVWDDKSPSRIRMVIFC